jgi:hypothetical protein
VLCHGADGLDSLAGSVEQGVYRAFHISSQEYSTLVKLLKPKLRAVKEISE